ncbi:collagen alpha-1(VI) chain-like [Actinia tenebrosa]|uniref:Collagen alpha-1(VI) chain-like n=1 Tax=Actinia tenebrosa TaxID=6105 RepID=A0A6P8J6A8_ACTTE|nr:collagen alpha-1(VI) chain-like [Actinia tenebrosa]XP_031575300.1 collagen alpha-1(VI) chain-like [Actinia tenebrosa]
MFFRIAVLVLVWGHLETGEGRSITDGDKKQVTCNKQIDLGITLDASASIGEENFKKYKRFSKELLSRFAISLSRTHVALSYFSMYHHIVATFNKSHTLEEANSIIDDMVYENSASKLSNAIVELHFAVFAGKCSGVRPKGSGSKMVSLFVTDGFSTSGYELTNSRAKDFHNYGIEAFAVYPNGKVHENILRSIASRPIAKHLFRLEEKQEKRRSLIDKIVRQICFGSYSKR